MSDQSISKGVKTSRQAGRGPGYPSLSLDEAVARLNQLRDANLARTTTSSLSVCKVWGWSSESGTARAALASLNHYNLIEYEGRGKNKQIRLTELAHRVIFDKIPNSKERTASLQQAALAPTYHEKLWEKYRTDLPPDHVIETYLILDCKFSETGAQALIREYRSTLEVAGLLKLSDMPTLNGDAVEAKANKPEIEVSDLMQVETNGALVPEKPALDSAQRRPLKASPVIAGIRQEIIALDEGDVVVTFPEGLSVESYQDLEEHLHLFLRKAKRRATFEKRLPDYDSGLNKADAGQS